MFERVYNFVHNFSVNFLLKKSLLFPRDAELLLAIHIQRRPKYDGLFKLQHEYELHKTEKKIPVAS